ncbi:NAD-P-binding protein [Schizopora paradoxa]|uniref:NAD-P-binding protein n=1 Tax=Schizopora paradoxa TaxID=27342 RepID=A0A0H2RUQ4_9AGAM|nr:NAD-P-binding protein [Schizopora paradoxa]
MASTHSGEKPIAVIAGVGNGSGTGGATARIFAKAGYRVALIARNADLLKETAQAINAAGGEAAPFPIAAYDTKSIEGVFATIKSQWPSSPLKVAVYNAAHGAWKPFLELKEDDIEQSVNVNIIAAFAFARQSILAFQQVKELDASGKKGTLIFTGATASIRGNTTTASFAAGKHGLRALSQSLNKEFGKQNIHVAHVIIDGVILTDRTQSYINLGEGWTEDKNRRLDPESIAKSYFYLANQDNSAFTWELDLRPAHEKW